jgi:hypothetical protein
VNGGILQWYVRAQEISGTSRLTGRYFSFI